MKPTSDLHDLIHSLSKNEKRHLSLSFARSIDKAHLRLFQLIGQQKQFDDNVIQLVLQREKIKYRLTELKHYLYDYILKELNSFHYRHSTESAFHQTLLEADILIGKNLYSQASKKIYRIKKMAEKAENHKILLQCYDRERIIWLRSKHMMTDQKQLSEALQKQLFSTKMIDLESKYKNMLDEQEAQISSTFLLREKNQKARINRLLNNPLLKEKNKTLTLHAKYLRYSAFLSCYHALERYEDALKSVGIIQELLEPHIRSDVRLFRGYLNNLSNKILYQGMLKKYSDALGTIGQLRLMAQKIIKDKGTDKNLAYFLLIKSSDQEIAMYIRIGEYEKAMQLIPETEQLIEKYGFSVPPEVIQGIYYNFSYVNFIFEKYKRTLFYLNKNLDYGENMREDIRCYEQILFILAQYELQQESLPEIFVKSTYDFLIKKKRLYKIEAIFMEFVGKKLLKSKSPEALNEDLRKLKRDIMNLKKNQYEKNALDYFDFISWVESKIIRQSFQEVLKKVH